VLTAKLARLDTWTQARRRAAGQYRAALAGSAVRMVDELPGSRGVYHLAVVRVPARERVVRRLAAMGIETGIHYPIPCHRQAPYRSFASGRLPAVEEAAAEILSLPIFPHMSDGQVARVCEAVREAIAREGAQVA
jgi:dTDP-4-amino-4,6-dideoxygalactose transaminase